jgi:hypothetical protein
MPPFLPHWRHPPPLIAGAGTALGVFALVVLWISSSGAERRAILRLSEDERGVLYHREFASFRTLCGEGRPRDALEKQCRERSEFLLEFPECDEACQGVVRLQWPPSSPR